jgi:hypothetical protein
VKRGLAKLRDSRVLNWIRRAAETRDEKGRFCLEQDTNAYGILPISHHGARRAALSILAGTNERPIFVA